MPNVNIQLVEYLKVEFNLWEKPMTWVWLICINEKKIEFCLLKLVVKLEFGLLFSFILFSVLL